MNTAKREAHSLPMNDQKRRREGVPSVKKVNFRRKLTADHAKSNEIQKTSDLKVKRSRRSKRRSSYSSCSESEVNEKRPAGKCKNPSTDVVFAQENYCSTPVRRTSDMQNCVAQVSASIHKHEPTFEEHISSPFGTDLKSVVDTSSFYGDDSALAALNLSEIISSSSAASDPVQRENCINSMKEESNQFYGLPLKVKELLQKYKGIESLYGKRSDDFMVVVDVHRLCQLWLVPTCLTLSVTGKMAGVSGYWEKLGNIHPLI